ncbi:MAG: acyl-CoA desaturase [Gammaproteobacteria bacterium]|nr:acyl-CoA desaturase [Gammaproteobacteria bacterium]
MTISTTLDELRETKATLRPSFPAGIKSDKEIYAELKLALQATDFFKPDPWAYVFRGAWVIAFALVAYVMLLQLSSGLAQLMLCMILGFLCVQSAAVAHEAAHGAVTHNRRHAQYIGQLFMNLIFGSSYAFWLHKHNQHHKKPNSAQDPDIRPGWFNFTEADATSAQGLSGFLTRHQHILIWPLSSLMGFSFKLASIRLLTTQGRHHRMDQISLVLHYLIWLVPSSLMIGFGDALVNYLLVTWFAGMYLSFIFITNHLGVKTYESCDHELGFMRQAATARNTSAHFLVTSLCNGLNSHIEHHLFPYVPFTRLALGREITQRILSRYGITYHQTSLLGAFHECYQYNKHLAMIARRGDN